MLTQVFFCFKVILFNPSQSYLTKLFIILILQPLIHEKHWIQFLHVSDTFYTYGSEKTIFLSAFTNALLSLFLHIYTLHFSSLYNRNDLKVPSLPSKVSLLVHKWIIFVPHIPAALPSQISYTCHFFQKCLIIVTNGWFFVPLTSQMQVPFYLSSSQWLIILLCGSLVHIQMPSVSLSLPAAAPTPSEHQLTQVDPPHT